MAHQFDKHYTLEQARALLPQLRRWLKRLATLRRELETHEQGVAELSAPGCDTGGELVNRWIEALAEVRELLLEFHHRDIQVKDVNRGLVDFPALKDGKEVFLCWEMTEEDIGFWHDLETGFPGREPLE
jgi:hypothetical protein